MNRTSDFNPWDGMRSISTNAYYVSRLVDESLNPANRDLQWSLTETGDQALLIGYNAHERHIEQMPRFRGIATGEDPQRHLMIIALQDPAMRDAFLKVCIDIITALQNVPESCQRHATILRLERWAHFFQGKRVGLTEAAQKGLVAELICLQYLALQKFTPREALQSWTGPQQSTHDFSFGQTSIEVKSNRGASTPNITISSSSQLSVNDNELLFLYVVEVNQAVAQSEGCTLTHYVRQTRALFDSPLDALTFDLKLSQVGYDETDDYDRTLWSVGDIRQFAVSSNFPHIDETQLDPAISNVTYEVNLNHCTAFEIDEHTLLDNLGGEHV